MPKRYDFENLRYCIDNYPAEYIMINLKASLGAKAMLKASLEGKIFDFKRIGRALDIYIDDAKRFRMPMKYYGMTSTKGLIMAYYRENDKGNMLSPYAVTHDTDPNDPKLPEPKLSLLRWMQDEHSFTLAFKGKIPIKFHSYWDEYLGWKYYTVDKNTV